MKTFLRAAALLLAALALVAAPASASPTTTKTFNDPVGDQDKRTGWNHPATTTAIRNSSDITSMTFATSNDRVYITWRIKDVLPYNDSFDSAAYAYGFLNGKQVFFTTGDGGRNPQFRVDASARLCTSSITSRWDPSANYASISVPTSCFPPGATITNLYGTAYTHLKRSVSSRTDGVGYDVTAKRSLAIR